MTSLSDDAEVFVKTNYSDTRFELEQMKKILPKYKLLTSSFYILSCVNSRRAQLPTVLCHTSCTNLELLHTYLHLQCGWYSYLGT